MTKDEIRDRMRERRRQVSDRDRSQAEYAIMRGVKDLDSFDRSWLFCCYLAVRSEISTRAIIVSRFQAGREVCVPAWDDLERRYGLFALQPEIPVVASRMGIFEPAVKIPVNPWDVDMFVLPGLAFDRRGGRIGYGGGYYDHILSKAHHACAKVAIGYDWQVMDLDLPLTEQDIRVDWIVTEQRIIDCRRGQT